jgi:hypothetical protein
MGEIIHAPGMHALTDAPAPKLDPTGPPGFLYVPELIICERLAFILGICRTRADRRADPG